MIEEKNKFVYFKNILYLCKNTMKTLSEIAIEAFKKGSDNFGESVIGVSNEIYHTPDREGVTYFGTPNNRTHKFYSKIVLLVQPDGHSCTSGIGFYIKDGLMDVCSGHMVFNNIPVTEEIQSELNQSIINEF